MVEGKVQDGWSLLQYSTSSKAKKKIRIKKRRKKKEEEEGEEENLLTSVQVNVAKISTRSEPAACGITIEASLLLLADSNSSRLPGTLRVLSSGTNACSSSYRFDKERSRAKD